MIRTNRGVMFLERSLAGISACLSLGSPANHTTLVNAVGGSESFLKINWNFNYEHVLGTSMQLNLRSPVRTVARAREAILSSIDRDEKTLSAWRRDSELSRWLATRNRPTALSPELLEVLSLFDHWHAKTGGALNPATEAARLQWILAASSNREPSHAELISTIAEVNQPHWVIDISQGTASHLTSTPLRLASFTKSYIADRAAQNALQSGASGIMLNIGGDIVVRGDLTQYVTIANPFAHAENDAPMDRIVLRDCAVATSGAYRRHVSAGRSHIFDPRTCVPAEQIASSTVIAADASTAGALATAFSVLTPDESHALAKSQPNVEYLLVTKSGTRIPSDGWHAYQAPASRSHPSAAAPHIAADLVDPFKDMTFAIELELAPGKTWFSKRPYVAVWVEDENHLLVRTIALWAGHDHFLPSLAAWYREDQLHRRIQGAGSADTITSATRPAGKYTLAWDGTDAQGRTIKAGTYTLYIEAAREHGGHDVSHQVIDFNGKAQRFVIAPNNEVGAVILDYRKR